MKNSIKWFSNYSKIAVVIISFFCLTHLKAADRFWVGDGTSTSWNNTGNWSTSSGGSSGASVPGSGDAAIFDGNGTGNCSIDINNVTVSSFSVTANSGGYGGTISFSGSYNFTCDNAFILDGNGSTFTSTSGTLTIKGNFTRNTSTNAFTHNSGTVIFSSNSLTITGNTTFNHLTFTNVVCCAAEVFTISTSPATTLTVGGTLTGNGSEGIILNGGIIDAKGNVTFANSYAAGGTALIKFSRQDGDQTLTGSQLTVSQRRGGMPKVEIAVCSTCTVTLVDTVVVMNDWTYTSGILNPGSSKLGFFGYADLNMTISGNMTLNRLEFYPQFHTTFNIANTLTVNNNLTFGSTVSNLLLTTGIINAYGNVIIYNTGLGNSGLGAGVATLKINGSGNQTLKGSGTVYAGTLPKIEINKPSGTLILESIISTVCDWTYTAGTVDAGTSTVAFCGNSSPQTISGNQTLYNATFHGTTNYPGTWTLPSDLTVTNNITYEGSNKITLNTGAINAKGNITITNTGTQGGGSATINLNGTSPQTITGLSGSNKEGLGALPKVTYTNTVTIANTVTANNDWTRGSGGSIIAGAGSTLAFSNTLTVLGSMDLVNLSFMSYSETITVGGSGNTTNITTSGTTRIKGLANGYSTNVNVYHTNAGIN